MKITLPNMCAEYLCKESKIHATFKFTPKPKIS